MPSLTAKSAAEMLRRPAYEQSRILTEQKYPKKTPQKFRTPYYNPVLKGIRDYYRTSNKNLAIGNTKNCILNISQETRRLNNSRAYENFLHSLQVNRELIPKTNSRVIANIGEIEFKLSADMQAAENNEKRIIYFNCKHNKLDDEVAKTTIEIAHWIAEQNGFEVSPDCFEYIDLQANKMHKIKKIRTTTIKRFKQTADIIEVLWPTL